MNRLKRESSALETVKDKLKIVALTGTGLWAVSQPLSPPMVIAAQLVQPFPVGLIGMSVAAVSTAVYGGIKVYQSARTRQGGK